MSGTMKGHQSVKLLTKSLCEYRNLTSLDGAKDCLSITFFGISETVCT